MELIGLAGYARTGKDTVGKILVEEHGYTRLAFADKLRECLYALNPIVGFDLFNERVIRLRDDVDAVGWEAAKRSDEVRELLQRMGTDVVRNILGEDVWVHSLFKDFPTYKYGKVVITDVRFPNEADAIVRRGGFVWRINRPGYAPVNSHISDTALDDYPFDAIINNNGTIDDLRNSVEGMFTRAMFSRS